MNKQSLLKTSIIDYNQAVVDAHNNILKVLLTLIASIERQEMRYTLQRQFKPLGETGIVHEIISPLFYLRLQDYCNGKAEIHYGYSNSTSYSPLTNVFARAVYSQTSVEKTNVNIEDCIRAERFIANTDELYEYIDETRKFHTFYLIPYRKQRKSKKLMQVA